MVLVTTWDMELNSVDSISVLTEIALSHCLEAGTLADPLVRLIEQKDWHAICEFEVCYDAKHTAWSYYNLRQALALFTKADFLDAGYDKEQRARDSFNSSNSRCRETNDIFKQLQRGEFNFPRDVDTVLHGAQRKIASVLGDIPSLDKLELVFGPGATTSVPKRNACARTKLSAVPSCTTRMIPIVPSLLRELPHLATLHAAWGIFSPDGTEEIESVTIEISDGRLAFVPKNAKTHRSVLTEPTLNAMLQGGYGRHLARRLRRVGQDVRDQTRNQRLAHEGSLTNALATLDLSSASDSISIEFVAHLLPIDWFYTLDRCCTRTALLNGVSDPIHLNMFSSMGNGFTFPLQTLLFWGLAVSACDQLGLSTENVSVYGDDIIVPSAAVSLLSRTLQCCGFLLNMEKSYWDGPFRESCGKDYFFGIDIRPYYNRKVVSGESLFSLHNYYVRNLMPERAEVIRGFLEPSLQIYGPDGYGDGHLIGRWTPRYHRRSDGYGGYLFDTFTWRGRRHVSRLPGDYVLPLYSIYVSRSVEESIGQYSVDTFGDPIPFLNGVPCLSLPGKSAAKRISIYTLTPPD